MDESFFNEHGLEYYYGSGEWNGCAVIIANLWYCGEQVEFHQPIHPDFIDEIDISMMYHMLSYGDVECRQVMYN